jgi:hypothetical protein
MKVALLINFIPPYHLPLLRLLDDAVEDLRIFVSTPMEANRPWTANWGSLHVVVQKSLTWRRRWRHPAGFTETQYRHFPLDTVGQLWRFQPDVVLSTEIGVRSLGAVLYRALRRRTRLMLWLNLSERTEVGRGRLRIWLRQRVLPRVDGIFVNGESGRRYLEGLGVPRSSIYALPYPTDVDQFGGLPLTRPAAQAKRMLYVGQLVPRKGVLEFVESLLRWLESHPEAVAELTIVGDGELRAGLEALQGSSPRLTLRFVGSVDYRELPALYASHGILVLPTLADEWGIVVNEALASGLPVLGSLHAQAVQELVEANVSGWLFDPEDPVSMRGALDRALTTPAADLERMRVACREKAFRDAPERLIANLLAGLTGAGEATESG